MSNIFENFRTVNRDIVKYDGAAGLEIETESLDTYEYPKMKYWNPVQDGSLRHFGVEYVLKQPLDVGKELDEAFSEFIEKTAKIRFIEDSISTSVHVHLNFLNDTFLTLANFLTVYALYENALIRYSGPDRLSNLFCLPMCDAEVNVDNIVNMLMNIGKMTNRFTGVRAEPERMKYAALNLASFGQRGSLEIRSFRGTTDIKLIQKWVGILTAMQEYARQVESPTHIIEFYKNSGLELTDVVFGKYADDLRYPDMDDLLKRNLWYAARIATSTKNWDRFGKFEQKKVNKKQVKRYFDEYASSQFGRLFADLNPTEKLVVLENIERDGINIQVISQEDEPVEEAPPIIAQRAPDPFENVNWAEIGARAARGLRAQPAVDLPVFEDEMPDEDPFVDFEDEDDGQ